MKISGNTKVYGIIGCPVEHSLSPVFQAYFAEKHKINAVYVPWHVEVDELRRAIDGLAALGVQGINVTVPYKETILSYVHADEDVRCIGAANTLTRNVRGWHASNTDWQGVAAVLQGMNLVLAEAQLLLFGAGGTARAVLHAAHEQGITTIAVCNRSAERVEKLIEHAKIAYPSIRCVRVAWEQRAVEKVCEESEVIINTTSIGLAANERFPFQLNGKGWAMDAVYKASGETAFTQAAKSAKRLALDGLPMLIAQGAKSFADWHPEETPDILDALAWMEGKLGRQKMLLPGWEGCT